MSKQIQNENAPVQEETTSDKKQCKHHHCGDHPDKCCHKHGRCGRFLFAIIAIFGIFWAANAIFGHHHSHHFFSQSDISEHVEYVAERISDHVDADKAQRHQIRAVAEAYIPRLQAMRSSHIGNRDHLIDTLAQPEIDRSNLESVRQSELAMLDENSRELMQMVADIADILTPQQRQQLAAEMATNLHHWH